MILTIFVQFFGLAGFSIIKNQVFSTRNAETVNNLIKKIQSETEGMLFEIDKLKRVKKSNDKTTLPPLMYDETMTYMGTIVRFSIKESFAGCQFWQDLHPQL